MIKYFFKKDFVCKCGCGAGKLDVRLLLFLIDLIEAKVTIKKISSAFRCSSHNKKEGGASDSKHLYGLAVDIHVSKDLATLVIIKNILKKYDLRYLDYPWGYHIDTGRIPIKIIDIYNYLS